MYRLRACYFIWRFSYLDCSMFDFSLGVVTSISISYSRISLSS